MSTNYLLWHNITAPFMIKSNMSYLRQITPCFILLISVVILSACQPASESPTTTPVIVVSDNHPQNTDYSSDISSAVNSAPPGAHIQITEGTYIVDNPVILRTRDVKLYGSGADKTIILAKNANQPVFLLEANGITIEAVTINALIDDGPERASFAIQIQEGNEHCKILQTNILNTAASAIIGHSASDCSLIGNTILNSGDDAVRLHGDRLIVIDNTIIGYFDEALDLAWGSNIVVTGNYAANGRIGIVVDNSTNTLISQNYVENQILEGIVTGADPDARIIANTVRNTGSIAFNLHTPRIVAYNHANGAHKIGFRITDMTNGILFQNITRGSSRDFVFKNVNNKTTTPGNNAGLDGDTRAIAGLSKEITFYNNCEQASSNSDDTTCSQHDQESHHVQKTAGHTIANAQPIYIFAPSVEIEGATPGDEKRANKVAALLKYYNPGILSIKIDGALMKSEITADFYEALKGAGELGMGLIRAPFLQFSRGGERSFLWYLSVEGKDVVVVSSIHDGPKTRISFLNNGELSFLNSAVLVKDKILHKLFK